MKIGDWNKGGCWKKSFFGGVWKRVEEEETNIKFEVLGITEANIEPEVSKRELHIKGYEVIPDNQTWEET